MGVNFENIYLYIANAFQLKAVMEMDGTNARNRLQDVAKLETVDRPS
jgi:hypothetical protein